MTKQSGSSLIEVLVSLLVLGVGVGGYTLTAIKLQQENTNHRMKMEAITLANSQLNTIQTKTVNATGTAIMQGTTTAYNVSNTTVVDEMVSVNNHTVQIDWQPIGDNSNGEVAFAIDTVRYYPETGHKWLHAKILTLTTDCPPGLNATKVTSGKVKMCHRASNTPHVLQIDHHAIPGHLDHGDTLGVCDGDIEDDSCH